MSPITNLTQLNSLETLAAIRGATWNSFGNPDMPPWMVAFSAAISTSQGDLLVFGEVEELDFEGPLELYSMIQAKPDSNTIKQSQAKANLYYFGKGQRINDILILREQVTKIVNERPEWSYIHDMAVVFVLDDQVIAFVQISRFMEPIDVMHASSLDELPIEDYIGEFGKPELGVEYMLDRKYHRVTDLLHGAA